MEISRRTFVGISASGMALLASGVPLSRLHAAVRAPAPTPRMPLHVFSQDPARLASLRRGVQVMQSRRESDPRSWFFQAAVHAVPAEWIPGAKQRDPGVQKVLEQGFWNQCPHPNLSSTKRPTGDFLLWHRAYLYYFERILRDAAGDETLSLPYWDYATDPRLALIPPEFKSPDPDPLTGTPNPLYQRYRDAEFVDGSKLLKESAELLVSLEKKKFFGTDSFAGMWDGGQDGTRGALQRNPHNDVHSHVGGWMANVPRAAFDPLFWVHHCNIDRLWAQWEVEEGREWGEKPPPSWFEERPWRFYDVDGQVVNPPRAHFVQRKWLPVTYDIDTPGRTALSDNFPVPDDDLLDLGEVLATRETTLLVENPRITEVATLSSGALAVSIQESPPVELGRLGGLQSVTGGEALLKARLGRPTSRAQSFVFLEITGLPANLPAGTGFDVHLNAAPGAAPDRSSASFVGTLDLFGGGGHAEHGGGFSDLFDVTDRALEDEGTATRVTLVPVARIVRDGAAEPPPPAVELSAEQVRIFVAEGRRQ